MAISYADGATIYNANRVRPPDQFNITTAEHYGRIRLFYDWFEVGTAAVPATVGSSDEVVLGGGLIPAGSRIVGGHFSYSDITSDVAIVRINIDTEANVGTLTPELEMVAHNFASLSAAASNCGPLIPWVRSDFAPYMVKTPSDFVVWIRPSIGKTFDEAGKLAIAIFYVYD